MYGYNSQIGYALTPIEINAYFNQATYALNKRIEKGQSFGGYNLPGRTENVVATLIIYGKLRGRAAFTGKTSVDAG